MISVLHNFLNMDESLKIKLSIADRVYPMTILPENEEGLRNAAKQIDALLKHYEQNYAVRDKQDVLAMCALHFASQTEQKSIDKERNIIQSQRRLDLLTKQIEKVLLERS